MRYMLLLMIAAAVCGPAQNGPDRSPPPAPAKAERLLSPDEEARLNKVEAAAEAATTRRKELQPAYQEAVNTELNALLVYSNSIRFVERGKCGKNEALAKPKGEWVCVGVNPQVPPPSQ